MPVREFIRTTKDVWYSEQLEDMFVNSFIIETVRLPIYEPNENIYNISKNFTTTEVKNIIALLDNNDVPYPIAIVELEEKNNKTMQDFVVILCIPDENTEVLRRIGILFTEKEDDENA